MSPESCWPEAWQAAGPPGCLPRARKSESSISPVLLEGSQLLSTDVQRDGSWLSRRTSENIDVGGAWSLPDITDGEIEAGVGK